MSNKYKIWWRPNFLDNDFEHKCSSVLEGYIGLEVCSFLDLPNSHNLIPNLIEQFPNHKRPFNIEWAYDMQRQCDEANTPFFFKQIDKVQEIPADLNIKKFPIF